MKLVLLFACFLNFIPAFSQKVKISLSNQKHTFVQLSMKTIINGDDRYELPSDSNQIILNLELPTKLRIEFKKKFIIVGLPKMTGYCDANIIDLGLRKLRGRKFNYIIDNCSSIGRTGIAHKKLIE